MTKPPDLPELALTEEEVDEILRSCDGRALLIGGQTLVFWAYHYGIAPPGALGANVTPDADFLGPAHVAREMAEALKPQGWHYWQPTMDDATPQTAKLSKRVEGEGIKQIDFLGDVIGLKRDGVMRRGRDAARSHLAPLRWHSASTAPSAGCAGESQELIRENETRLLLNAIERITRKRRSGK